MHQVCVDDLMKPDWWISKDSDLDCAELYERHYSRYKYADGRTRNNNQFVGPGKPIVLRTKRGDAVWVWREFIDDCIDERTGQRQEGINCAVFRNESPHRSSDLIRQADAIADAAWPYRRHYTYVDPEEVASTNPGYCFLCAGWQKCGRTKGGLIVIERIKWAPVTTYPETGREIEYRFVNGRTARMVLLAEGMWSESHWADLLSAYPPDAITGWRYTSKS